MTYLLGMFFEFFWQDISYCGKNMDFDLFVSKLKLIQGLQDLKPNSDGSYVLKINRLHLVYFSKALNNNDLLLYSPVCLIPIDERERLALLDRLLSANMFGEATGNSWFASDLKSHQIFLISRLLLFDLTPQIFSSELQKFISFLSLWKDLIGKLPHQYPSTKKIPDKSKIHFKL